MMMRKKKNVHIKVKIEFVIRVCGFDIIENFLLIFLPRHSIGNCAENSLHHRQMLTVVVSLEERDAQI